LKHENVLNRKLLGRHFSDQNFGWVFDPDFLEVQHNLFMSPNFGDVVHNMQNTKLDDFLKHRKMQTRKIGRVLKHRKRVELKNFWTVPFCSKTSVGFSIQTF